MSKNPLIVHMDADAFFASCEVARNPMLAGKPLVVGAERGIASAFSYEAKALGITRAMPIFQIKRRFPGVIVRPGDYRLYGALSRRMIMVVKKHIDEIDQYGIDEAFFEIPKDTLNPYALLLKIKKQIRLEVGIDVSFGAGKTKTLAKQASKYNKPNGLVILTKKNTQRTLEKIPVGDVWGIGKQTTKKLHFYGVQSAADFIAMPERWVSSKFSISTVHTWHELHGKRILKLSGFSRAKTLSVTSSRTFLEKSKDVNYILKRLAKNIESASISVRRANKTVGRATILLKQSDLSVSTLTVKLPIRSNHTHVLLGHILPAARKIIQCETFYRTTGVTLENLLPDIRQEDLFGEIKKHDSFNSIYQTLDQINKKLGTGTVSFGSAAYQKRN